jgi:ABC-type transporter Mla MlaB component
MTSWTRQQRTVSPTADHPSQTESLIVKLGNDGVCAIGTLDEFTVELLIAAADNLFARGCRDVTLDLSDTSAVDSAAVRALFTAQADVPPDHRLHLRVPGRLRPRLAVCESDGT